jgi:large subunit ribosomal protein L32
MERPEEVEPESDSIGENMAVPKRKKSKSRVRMLRRSHKGAFMATKPCPQCGAPHLPHRVCPSCGFYAGRQVITVESA